MTWRKSLLRWIAPPEKDTATTTLEKRLWDAAAQFRANFGLKPEEYSGPTLVPDLLALCRASSPPPSARLRAVLRMRLP